MTVSGLFETPEGVTGELPNLKPPGHTPAWCRALEPWQSALNSGLQTALSLLEIQLLSTTATGMAKQSEDHNWFRVGRLLGREEVLHGSRCTEISKSFQTLDPQHLCSSIHKAGNGFTVRMHEDQRALLF